MAAAITPRHGPAGGNRRSEKVSQEIERIESLLTSTMKLMDDPELELSMVMRKRNELRELESYLRGIRFATEPESVGG